jgi:hypothetical protein
MRAFLRSLAGLGCLLLSPAPLFAGAAELSRVQLTRTSGQNTITVDGRVNYGGYSPGETIRVTLDYSATCNIVFRGLTSPGVRPFSPPKVTGTVGNVSGTPTEGHGTTSGSASFDIRFTTLNQVKADTQSGLAYLDLVLGVDKDCNLATGDPDGIDTSLTIRAQILVSTGVE